MTKTDRFGLLHFAEACQQMRLTMSAATAQQAHRSLMAGRLRHQAAAELVHNTFEGEISQAEPRLSNGYWILKKLFLDLYDEIRGSTTRSVRLFDYREFERIEELEGNLGPIYDEAQTDQASSRTKYLLLCLAHVIRWEVRGREVERQLRQVAGRAYRNNEEKQAKTVTEFLTIDRVGTDGMPDTLHLRNAISHGLFHFLDSETIRFRDRGRPGGPLTFAREMKLETFSRLCDLFEIRLRLFPLYVEFSNVMVLLTRPIFATKRGDVDSR